MRSFLVEYEPTDSHTTRTMMVIARSILEAIQKAESQRNVDVVRSVEDKGEVIQ